MFSSGYDRVEQNLFHKAAIHQIPIYGGFEITPYCNLSCKMCYIKEVTPNLPVLDAETWIEYGRQAVQMGTLVVQLTGGEPMLHPEFKKIYCGLKSQGLVLTMNTNATLIDQNMADFLAQNMPRRVNVSLYGASENVYQELCGDGAAFCKVIRAIELMRSRKIPVKINIVPNRINFAELDEMLQICRQYRLAVDMTPYLFEPIRKSCNEKQLYRLDPESMAIAVEKWNRYRYSEEDMQVQAIVAQKVLERYDKSEKNSELTALRCYAGTSSYWICWDGKMNPCASMISPRADISEMGFSSAWEKVKEERERILVPAKCTKCSLKGFCQSCAAMGYHENGTFEQVPQIMCDATEAYARNLAKQVCPVEKKTMEES